MLTHSLNTLLGLQSTNQLRLSAKKFQEIINCAYQPQNNSYKAHKHAPKSPNIDLDSSISSLGSEKQTQRKIKTYFL